MSGLLRLDGAAVVELGFKPMSSWLLTLYHRTSLLLKTKKLQKLSERSGVVLHLLSGVSCIVMGILLYVVLFSLYV